MTGEGVKLVGSGRTDAGVHALAQVANFKCDTSIPPQAFLRGLNSLLAADIVIKDCAPADENFHARFSVKRKVYEYRILNQAIPPAIGRQYAWHIIQPLHPAAMRLAISNLIGTHDFKAFEGSGSPRSNTIRQIFKAEIKKTHAGFILIEIEADGFLKFMVRNIVGTLADIGLEKLPASDLQRILTSRDRSLASATAPPHGLFLKRVIY